MSQPDWNVQYDLDAIIKWYATFTKDYQMTKKWRLLIHGRMQQFFQIYALKVPRNGIF